MGFSGGASDKEPANVGDIKDAGSVPSPEYPLEKGMAAHSILAWRIPWTEEPGGLQSTQPWGCKELDMQRLSMHT